MNARLCVYASLCQLAKLSVPPHPFSSHSHGDLILVCHLLFAQTHTRPEKEGLKSRGIVVPIGLEPTVWVERLRVLEVPRVSADGPRVSRYLCLQVEGAVKLGFAKEAALKGGQMHTPFGT